MKKLLFLLLLSLTPFSQADEPEAETEFDMKLAAFRLEQEGNYVGAVKIYEEMVDKFKSKKAMQKLYWIYDAVGCSNSKFYAQCQAMENPQLATYWLKEMVGYGVPKDSYALSGYSSLMIRYAEEKNWYEVKRMATQILNATDEEIAFAYNEGDFESYWQDRKKWDSSLTEKDKAKHYKKYLNLEEHYPDKASASDPRRTAYGLLAQMYFNGEGARQDYNLSWQYATNEKVNWGMTVGIVAIQLYEGLGVKQDKQKALDVIGEYCDRTGWKSVCNMYNIMQEGDISFKNMKIHWY
ncbi:hypothetical protein O1Q79_01887 [Lonepinella sp. MS14434]|uniref:hypothetical protein n=1 Tax=Lonepinella sp. MS14434 TaxID=3003617 RepID=UPI0036DCD01C